MKSWKVDLIPPPLEAPLESGTMVMYGNESKSRPGQSKWFKTFHFDGLMDAAAIFFRKNVY